ncbi:hypothetical protein LZ554_007930 [Drepanopeziza brunnea f. sp. 'monogermtubi']|nr:hypothetical protein LZ554_007930 [Drepanopeziza brunnea f. sp. 'monogermtubi']
MKETLSNLRSGAAGESSTDQKESDDVKGLAAGKKQQTRKKPKASRVVSNLSADQLERKRLADRNAQRTVRQRTQDYTSNLEARIEELVREQAMLEDAERRTEALEEELRGLRLMLEKSSLEICKAQASAYKAKSVEKTGNLDVQNALKASGQLSENGPWYPNVDSLVAPELSHRTSLAMFSVTRVTYRSFIEKLASMVLLSPLYRWMMLNTYNPYAELPSMTKPSHLQRLSPTPIWLCAISSPAFGDVIIRAEFRWPNVFPSPSQVPSGSRYFSHCAEL